MARVYKTLQGKVVDMDSLVTAHGKTIAVGNMKVNAQGDELGAGGRVVKTKAEVMRDYYALKTPTATADSPIAADADEFEAFESRHAAAAQAKKQQVQPGAPITQQATLLTPKVSTQTSITSTTPPPTDGPATPSADSAQPANDTGLRGGLAASVAAKQETAVVNQGLLTPLDKRDGIKRI